MGSSLRKILIRESELLMNLFVSNLTIIRDSHPRSLNNSRMSYLVKISSATSQILAPLVSRDLPLLPSSHPPLPRLDLRNSRFTTHSHFLISKVPKMSPDSVKDPTSSLTQVLEQTTIFHSLPPPILTTLSRRGANTGNPSKNNSLKKSWISNRTHLLPSQISETKILI